MASESNEELDADVGAKRSAWLDEDQPARSPVSQTSDGDSRRVADLQLVDALLGNLAIDSVDERERRIQRVMDRVSVESVGAVKAPKHNWTSILAIAASLMVVGSLAWSFLGRVSHASVVLQKITERAAENTDRVYVLTRGSGSAVGDQSSVGKLFLRGREGFALKSGPYVLGRNRHEFWLVPKHGDVLVADQVQWIVRESERLRGEVALLRQLSADSARVPIMHLPAVLDLLKQDYRLTLERVEIDGSNTHSIKGTRKKAIGNLPNRIELHADFQSMIVRHARVSWEEKRMLAFELVPHETLPNNWYSPEAHYQGDRQKRRITH